MPEGDPLDTYVTYRVSRGDVPPRVDRAPDARFASNARVVAFVAASSVLAAIGIGAIFLR